MVLFLVNLLIAMAWVFLGEQPRFADFVIGFLLGYGMLALCAPLMPSEKDYLRRSGALVRFAWEFTLLFIKSNWVLALAVLRQPNDALEPNFVEYDIEGLNLVEILLLTHCISLTPGTTSAYISPDRRRLMVHAFDARDPEALREEIARDIERKILAFTR